MSEYQIGRVLVTEMRTVIMAIGTSEIIQGNGAKFQPDRLAITYRNGKVQSVVMSGPAMTTAGKPYANSARGHRLYDHRMPDWMTAEVQRYMPKEAVAKHDAEQYPASTTRPTEE